MFLDTCWAILALRSASAATWDRATSTRVCPAPDATFPARAAAWALALAAATACRCAAAPLLGAEREPVAPRSALPAWEPRVRSEAGSAPLPPRLTRAAELVAPPACVGSRHPSAENAFGALAATTPTAVTARTPVLASRRPVRRVSRADAPSPASGDADAEAEARSRARSALRDGRDWSPGAAHAFVEPGDAGSNRERAPDSGEEASSAAQGACHS